MHSGCNVWWHAAHVPAFLAFLLSTVSSSYQLLTVCTYSIQRMLMCMHGNYGFILVPLLCTIDSDLLLINAIGCKAIRSPCEAFIQHQFRSNQMCVQTSPSLLTNLKDIHLPKQALALNVVRRVETSVGARTYAKYCLDRERWILEASHRAGCVEHGCSGSAPALFTDSPSAS